MGVVAEKGSSGWNRTPESFSAIFWPHGQEIVPLVHLNVTFEQDQLIDDFPALRNLRDSL